MTPVAHTSLPTRLLRSGLSRACRQALVCLSIVAAALLSACGTADQLAGHSLEYNSQAKLIKNRTLLINIVRAAYRKPLQFTDLTTINGQLIFDAGAALSVPLWGASEGNSRLAFASPSIEARNSPSYTVAVLNTKEFYQGILSPLPVQTVAYYLDAGFPKPLVLNLMLAGIDYGGPGAVRTVRNSPNRPEFTELLRTLIALGLSVEQVDKVTVLGGPFGESRYPSAKDIGELDAKGIKLVRHALREPGTALSSAQAARFRRAGYYYQLEKPSRIYRFCFNPLQAVPGTIVRAGTRIGDTGETIEASELCGAGRASSAATSRRGIDTGQDGAHALSLRTRSTEGVIYYLGEIARCQLGLAEAGAPCSGSSIFRLQEGPGGDNTIGVGYEGRSYHIAVDPTGDDRSSQVLDLVTELLAQNNSAKDLPAPSVIPVTR